jgi:hypothetical protein
MASGLGLTEIARKLIVWGRNVQTLDRRVRRHFFAIVL